MKDKDFPFCINRYLNLEILSCKNCCGLFDAISVNVGGEIRSIKMGLNKDYTFDIFLCVAILILNKNQVSIEQDAASIYGCLNRYVP